MKWRCGWLEVTVKYDFPVGCCGGKDSFIPPIDNSDIILLNHMRIINKNNTIWIQNLFRAESRTCEQSGITNAKANRTHLVCLGKMLTLGVHEP